MTSCSQRAAEGGDSLSTCIRCPRLVPRVSVCLTNSSTAPGGPDRRLLEDHPNRPQVEGRYSAYMTTSAPASRKARGSEAAGSALVQSLLRQTVSSSKLPSALLEVELWASLARGSLTVGETMILPTPDPADSACRAGVDLEKVRAEVDQAGHGRLPAERLGWGEVGVPLRALSETIDALQLAGYPPVFILMYDQAWALCERLFDAMEVLHTSMHTPPCIRPMHIPHGGPRAAQACA